MPTISIIVPIYNVENYLSRCIDSILTQTFTDFELIMVDDGSTDQSIEICYASACLDDRIRVLHQDNQGQAAARNVALDWIFENSSSEWIAFVDADDWIHPQFLEILLKNAVKTKASVSLCGFVEIEDESTDNVLLNQESSKSYCGRDFVYDSLKNEGRGVWVLCDKLWRRDLWNSVRLPVGRIYEDNATVYKILYSVERVVTTDTILYYYYQNPSSTMHAEFSIRKLDWPLVLKEMTEFFHEKEEPELANISLRRYFNTLLWYYESVVDIDNQDLTLKVKRELRLAAKELNKKEKITIRSYPYYFKIVYPLYSKCYWKTTTLLRKVRELL